MPDAPPNQFSVALVWKVVPAIILAGITVLVLRELLHWIDRRPIRAMRPMRSRKRNKQDQEQAPINVTTDTIPRCPLCDGLMVERTVRDGTNAGSTFLGCFGYPRCRGTRAMAELDR